MEEKKAVHSTEAPRSGVSAPATATDASHAVSGTGRRAPSSGRQTSARLEWVDTARACCVIAVVAYHLYIWHFATMGVSGGSIAGAAWEEISDDLGALRMPLLLVLSGMLATSKIRHGFGHGKTRRSVVSNYYLYLVWLLIYAVVGSFLGSYSPTGHLQGDLPVALQLIVPDTTLWFIYALAVYVPALSLVRMAPPLLIIGVLAVINVAIGLLADGTEPLGLKVIRLAVYFAIGVHAKDLIFRLVGTHKYAMAGVGLVAVPLLTVVFHLGIPAALNETLHLFRALAFVGASFGITAMLVRFRWCARAGRWVGTRTLGIYVLHPVLIIALSILADGPLRSMRTVVADSTALALIYPVATTVLIVSTCVLIERLLIACRLGVLFRAPAWIVK
ncbi:acyltransferase family protein [Kocuria sp. M4R2S49]|uniref:acyltransferase family protein n=1 Tax=Kocuria rhizosphaericola TaxID=3376284 RepID=UPI0037929598